MGMPIIQIVATANLSATEISSYIMCLNLGESEFFETNQPAKIKFWINQFYTQFMSTSFITR